MSSNIKVHELAVDTGPDGAYYIIPPNTNVYRGDTKEYVRGGDEIPETPTFFGLKPGYVKNYGLVNNYFTTRELKLIALDKPKKNQSLYDSSSTKIRNILNRNYGFQTGLRDTDYKQDHELVKYLCKEGYDGYFIGRMPVVSDAIIEEYEDDSDDENIAEPRKFHAEMAICNPKLTLSKRKEKQKGDIEYTDEQIAQAVGNRQALDNKYNSIRKKEEERDSKRKKEEERALRRQAGESSETSSRTSSSPSALSLGRLNFDRVADDASIVERTAQAAVPFYIHGNQGSPTMSRVSSLSSMRSPSQTSLSSMYSSSETSSDGNTSGMNTLKRGRPTGTLPTSQSGMSIWGNDEDNPFGTPTKKLFSSPSKGGKSRRRATRKAGKRSTRKRTKKKQKPKTKTPKKRRYTSALKRRTNRRTRKQKRVRFRITKK